MSVQCPSCGSPDSMVTDSRHGQDYIRRRRRCDKCRLLFTTHEIVIGDKDAKAHVHKVYQIAAALEAMSLRRRNILESILVEFAGPYPEAQSPFKEETP